MCYVLRVVNNENYQSGCKQRRVPQKKTTKKRKKFLHPRVVCYKLWKELMGERCATLWGTPTMKIINLHLSKGGSCKKTKQKRKIFCTPCFSKKIMNMGGGRSETRRSGGPEYTQWDRDRGPQCPFRHYLYHNKNSVSQYHLKTFRKKIVFLFQC